MARQVVLPSRLVTLSASGKRRFRGSMASLRTPLPTLRLVPRGTRRTARGRCDSLGLHRRGLAPPAPCRSPGALPAALKINPCPGSTGDGIDALRISDEELPSLLAGGDDGFVAVPDEPAELVATEIVPNVLHRVEFRRIGR